MIRPTPPYPLVYEALLRLALAEDLGRAGDITTEATIPPEAVASAQLVARSGGQELLVGERIAAQTHPRAQRLVGDYQPVLAVGEYPLIEKVTIAQESGVLVARTTLRIGNQPAVSIPLRILADDQALLLGVRADAGEIVRLREVDGETRFDFSGYEFRPMR